MKITLRKIILCGILSAFYPAIGWAELGAAFYTGNNLLSDCNAGSDFKKGLCVGYITGVGNGVHNGQEIGFQSGLLDALFEMYGDKAEANKENILKKVDEEFNKSENDGTLIIVDCRPEGVINQQLVDVVVKYLVQQPEKRASAASELIIAALNQAFPCRKAKP